MQEVIYRRARKRVNKKKAFYWHLSIYVTMGLFFFIMNMVTLAPGNFELWFFFPLLPWGVAMMIHYYSVFGLPFTGALSSEWEERELRKEMERLESLVLPPAPMDRKHIERYHEEEEELELRQVEKLPSENWRKDDLV